MSPSFNLKPWASRRKLAKAIYHVYKNAGHTPGRDGRTFRQVFGRGRKSHEYKATMAQLRRGAKGFRFSTPRCTLGPKGRPVSVITFWERIFQSLLIAESKRRYPPRRANLSREGLDGRWGVQALALLLSTRSGLVVAKTDFKNAFESLRWQRVLETKAARRLGPGLLAILKELCAFYSPSGIGMPAGLPISGLVLDLACDAFDSELAELGLFGVRFVDDVLLVGATEDVGDHLAKLVKAVDEFGLRQHPKKTKLYDLRCCRATFVEFLGFAISGFGEVDVTEETASRLASAKGKKLAQMTKHFELALEGGAYRKALGFPLLSKGSGLFSPVGTRSLGLSTANAVRTNRPHPSSALAGAPKASSATVVNSGGGCRGGRGKGRPRSPRPERSNLDSQLQAWGGYLGMLRAAEKWSGRCGQHLEELQAKVLFGEGLERVRQYSRCLSYWRTCREFIWSGGIWLSEEQQEVIIERIWPVLVVAATLTQCEALLVCETDPVEELLLVYGGARQKREAIERIHLERTERMKKAPRNRKSLLGHYVGPW